MRPSRRTLLATALCTALAAASPFAQAADAPITIMVGGINKIIYLPAKLTEALGYFKDAGLNVELQSQPAGVDAENQLIAGAVQGVVGFYDHTIDLQSKGKEVQAIAVFCKVPGEVEMVSTKAAAAGFKSMADAKGKTLGVTGLGSSTDFLTRYLADRQGVASKDYSLLPIGAGNTFIAAIKQDRVQAGMTTEPTVSQLLKTGDAKVLVDLRTEEGTKAALGGLYPAASLYVQNTWAESHKEEASKLAQAFARTMAYIHTHTAERDCRAGAARLLRQRQGPVCDGAEILAADVHHRRPDAGRRPGNGAQGARDLQTAGQEQEHRPVQDLQQRLPGSAQVIMKNELPAGAGNTPAIDFRDVSLRFISADGNATVALRNFSMSVARGEFVAIVGPTGCGKSTTLNMITGLLRPTVGEVRCHGPAGAGHRPAHRLRVPGRRGVPVAQRDRQRRGRPAVSRHAEEAGL